MNTITGKSLKSRFVFPAITFGMLLCGACLSVTSAAAQEPVLGTWEWANTDQDFTLLPDGTAVQGGQTGQWVCVNPKASPRVYQVNWEKGLVLDTLYLVQGGAQLIGQNQTNYHLLATRAGGAPAPVATGVEAASPVNYIDQLAEQLPRAQEWVFAPLDTPMPANVRQAFDTIDATLQAQAASVSPADLAVYQQGWGVWRNLMAVLHERDAWLRRNFELNHGAGLPEAWKTAWAQRARLAESAFATPLTRFHEAVRLHPGWAGSSVAQEGRKFAMPAGTSAIASNERHAESREARGWAPPAGHNPPHIAEGPAQPQHVSHAVGHRGGGGHGHGHRIP